VRWSKLGEGILCLLLPVNSVPEQQKGVSPTTDFFPGEASNGVDHGCLYPQDDLNKSANQVETLISKITYILFISKKNKTSYFYEIACVLFLL